MRIREQPGEQLLAWVPLLADPAVPPECVLAIYATEHSGMGQPSTVSPHFARVHAHGIGGVPEQETQLKRRNGGDLSPDLKQKERAAKFVGPRKVSWESPITGRLQCSERY